jgi:multiple sugar transport system substrate-binding protein
MSRVPRLHLLVLLTVLALLAGACAGGEEGGTDDGTPAPGDTAEETDEPAETEPADDEETDSAASGEAVTIEIAENAVRGGKNTIMAEYLIEWAIPTFEEQMAEEGQDVTVEFTESGIDDEDYKSRLALDLSVGEGPDIIGFDSFWLSEFVAAGYLSPLSEVVGEAATSWDGWDQIPDAVAGSLELDGERYGIPLGTDGRVIFYRSDIFAEAGLPEDWEPQSWDDILEAARTIDEALPDVIPLQLNAGTSMGEATTLQGFIPILLGTGAELHDGEQWLGDTPELREALTLFDEVYAEGLGDAQMQVRADGRDRSFQEFAEGRLAMLIESDYLWRGVIAPEGSFPIENREEVVGYTKIPAREPGGGIRGQDFVSASGGTGRVLNPNSEHPEMAWEFLQFLGSEEALTEFVTREPRVTAREDVNADVVGDDPMLSFIAEETLPITWYRPGFEEYPQVSEAIQQMVENVVADRSSVEEAAAEYQSTLEGIVGADNVRSSDG